MASSFVCQPCLESICAFFEYKQRVCHNLRELAFEESKLLANVSEFIENSNEDLELFYHHNCLSLVPPSSGKIIRNFICFNPIVNLGLDVNLNPDQTSGLSQHGPDIKIEELGVKLEKDNSLDDRPLTFVPFVNEQSQPNLKPQKKRQEKYRKMYQKQWISTQVKLSKRGDIYVCSQCQQILTSRETIRSHLMNHAETETQLDEKSQFQPMTVEEWDWTSNQVDLSQRSNGRFQCTQCTRKLASKAAIHYHLVSIHVFSKESSDWVFSMIKKGKFTENSDGNSITKWKCDQCQTIFRSMSNLRTHLHTSVCALESYCGVF
jgi:hypothetical protein